MSTIYLSGTYSPASIESFKAYFDTPDSRPLSFLVAYPFLKDFEKARKHLRIEKWCLDSGAFSVFNSGKVIDLKEYIAVCKDVDAAEKFGLDVIGDYKAGIKNIERMWKASVDVIPVYHPGEPWSVLDWACANADKIAIGSGRDIAKKDAVRYIDQCFARVWPKKIHGFAITAKTTLERLPFHSCDSTTWCLSPCAYGSWLINDAQGQARLSARIGANALSSSIRAWQEREDKLRQLWRKDMAMLEAMPKLVRQRGKVSV